GRKDRAETEIVYPQGFRLKRLDQVMGRDSDEHLRPKERARLGHGEILLAEMHAVRSDRKSDIAAIVHDEQTTRRVDHRRQGRCQVIKHSGLRSLYAKLERADALL